MIKPHCSTYIYELVMFIQECRRPHKLTEPCQNICRPCKQISRTACSP